MRILTTSAAFAAWPVAQLREHDLQRTTGSSYCRGRQSLCAPQPSQTDKAAKPDKAEPDKPRTALMGAAGSSEESTARAPVPAPEPNWPAAEDTEFFIDPAAHYDWR